MVVRVYATERIGKSHVYFSSCTGVNGSYILTGHVIHGHDRSGHIIMWLDLDTLLCELGDRALLCLLNEDVYVLTTIPAYTLT
ncbi:hypothetical protein LCGC14_2638860 [marine sediment metagenome]|uniref:Uncharacterized protein n=1 Tax=marine sediment metagenome TaxID=412755 RepID=A0A0F9AKK4_9ZZZZ